jgi:NAD(P)-dependent dehydrogenase (short-subunit alcohol dehydrogenase family)
MTLSRLFDLSGRIALVTGGAGHLGRTFASTLLEMGARVALLDVCTDVPEAAQALCTDGRAKLFTADLEHEESLRAGFAAALAWGARLDILINNAAFVGTSNLTGWGVQFEQQESGTFRRAIEVNLTAAFTLCQLAAPHLREGGHGAIVNIASIYGIVGPDNRLYDGTPMGNPVAYGASKAGLLQLTRHLSTTLAPHVRVNAITPGGVERGQPPAFQERYRARTPIGRMATEQDFCGAMAYLASDASAYVTGHNLIVDGGWSAW